MNSSKVLQCPTGTQFLVICNGSQLQIQPYVMYQLISSTNNSTTAELPMTIISVMGQPSTGKTAYANAIMRHLQSMAILHGGQQLMMTGFPDPKGLQHDDQVKIDGILVSIPPFIVEDSDGRRAGVILLDVWNNGTMSKDVYMKLMDFCFYVSSIQIVIAGGPLRQVSWWVGDFPWISNEKEERDWLSITTSLSKAQDGDAARVSYLIALNGGSSVRKWCPSVQDLDEGSLDICTSDFDFIMKQIFCPQSEALAWRRLSDLGAHFEHGVACVNNPQLFAPEPEISANQEEHFDLLATEMDGDPSDSVPTTLSPSPTIATAVASPEPEFMSQYELVGAFKDHLHQAHARSAQLCLNSWEFYQLLDQFQRQSGSTEILSYPSYEPVRKFYETIQVSQIELNAEIARVSESFGVEVENAFVMDPEGCQARHCIQRYRSRAHLIAEQIASSMVTQLKLQELQLPRETDILTFKLKTKVQWDILNHMECLEQQIEVCQAALAQYKQRLYRKLEHLVCISQGKFEEAVMHSRSVLAQMVTGVFRPALETAVVKAAENFEEQLRLYNQQTFDAEFDFARAALSSSITVMQQLLTSHLRQHKIMTDKELSDAFDSLCSTVKKACSSVPEVFLNDAWEAAWEDLRPSLQNCQSQLRRQNRNRIRKWDRELKSAIEKSALVYNQEMDQRLPNYNLPAMELDKMHFECAQCTLQKFTVSSEINEETRNYWMLMLELSKLNEWRHGYTILNEKKKLPTPLKQMAADMDYGNSRAKLLDLPACHIGIYFGPEVVIFTALVSDGPQPSSEISVEFPVTVKIKPLLAFRRGKIVYGEQALKTKSRSGGLFNVFTILAGLSEPTQPSSLTVETNGQKISVTPEAAAVLFFREAINQLSGITGRRVQTCTVAHPARLRSEATRVITEAIKIAGFSKVNLIPIATTLASSYVRPLLEGNLQMAKKRNEFVAVYYAGDILEISLIQLTGRYLEKKSLKGCFDLGPERKKEDILTRLMHECFAELTPKHLFATVLILGNEDEDNVAVQDTLMKVVGDLNCPHKLVKFSSGIAKTVAKMDAGISSKSNWLQQQALSINSTLPHAWNRETVKAQVQLLLRLMEMEVGTSQQRPGKEKEKVINEEGHTIAHKVDSLRCQLAELVQRVEGALKKSSASEEKHLSGFIKQSVQQCNQLLQTATTKKKELTKAMDMLQIRSEDLLKDSSEERLN